MSEGSEGIVTWQGLPEWVRGPARIIDDEIVLDESRAEHYFLHNVDEALLELAACARAEDFKAFVRRYGLLWHGSDSLNTGQCREALTEWHREAREAKLVVLLYMKLTEAMKTGSVDPMRPLDSLWSGFPETANDEEYLRQHSVGLAGLIGARLKSCRVDMIPAFQREENTAPNEFVFTHEPPNLLITLYTVFAEIVAQRAEIRECIGCGRLFHPKSGRQKYCSESCASTSRWRRWNEKQQSQ